MKKLVLVFLSVLLLCSVSFGQGLGLNSIAPKVGLIMPEDPWDTGFLLGAKANLGEVYEGLDLVPSVTYWSSGYDYNIGDLSLSLSNIQVGADVHYAIPNVDGAYAGGGLSLNFVTLEVPTVNFLTGETGTESDTDTKFGFDFLAGYEIPFGDSKAFVEAKYNIISDLSTFEITAGYYFDLSK